MLLWWAGNTGEKLLLSRWAQRQVCQRKQFFVLPSLCNACCTQCNGALACSLLLVCFSVFITTAGKYLWNINNRAEDNLYDFWYIPTKVNLIETLDHLRYIHPSCISTEYLPVHSEPMVSGRGAPWVWCQPIAMDTEETRESMRRPCKLHPHWG